MARGQPEGEQGYTPEVSAEDFPRKMVPQIRQGPITAEAFGTAANEIGKAAYGKFEADSAAFAGDQLADFRVKAIQNLQQMKDATPAGQDPGNFTEKWAAQFDKQAQPLVDNADINPIAHSMIAKGLTEMRDSLTQHVLGWESEQRVAYRTDSVLNNLKSQSAVVEAHPELAQSVGSTLADQVNSIGGDPRARLTLMRRMDEQLSEAAANGLSRQAPRGTLMALNDPEKAPPGYAPLAGLNDAQRETVRAKANEQLSKPVYSLLGNDDERGARGYLEQNRDIMDPKVAWQLDRTIDAQLKEKQNEQKQDIADRYQDSLKAAEFGLPNAMAVTKAELSVLYPKDAQRHWDLLQAAQSAGAQAHEYDRMTPEEIQADVQKSRPKEGGPEAAIQIEGYDVRARAQEQSLRAREADPAAFAVRNGSWDALDFSDPKKLLDGLSSRANTQEEVSRQTGTNTPLLSKPEQRAITQFLDSQPPDQRLGTLAQLRQSMPSDVAYGSLMRQLSPNSPLTAIAGATLDKPQNVPWYDPKFATLPIVGQRILEGDAILAPHKNEKGEMVLPKFPMPNDKDLSTYFAAAIGGSDSDLFRGRDQTEEAYEAAFKAVYAAEASAQGKTSGILDSSIAEQSARAVIGHVATYGHSTVPIPSGMDPTHFEGSVNAATRTALTEGGYSKQEIASLHGYGLRELGDTLGTGRYVIINGAGDPLRAKDGKSIVYVDLSRPYGPEEAATTSTPGFPTHGR